MSHSELMQQKFDLNGISASNDYHACTPVYSVPSPKTANKHCGIMDKGNTCYANVILQCLKAFPVLWSSNNQIKWTLSSSVRKMFLLYSKKSPTYPSFFLKSLKDAFIKVGCPSFDLHAQQHVVEVLEILLERLTGPSIVTSAAYNIKSLTSFISHTWYPLNRTEDILPILCVPVLKDFSTSFAKVLETDLWLDPTFHIVILAQV